MKTSPRNTRSPLLGSTLVPAGRDNASLRTLARALGPVVYMIRTQDGLIKVGHTTHLDVRKRAFGSGWDHILAITPGNREDEAAMHARLAPHLVRGREYFAPHAEVIEAVNEIRERMGVPAYRP